MSNKNYQEKMTKIMIMKQMKIMDKLRLQISNRKTNHNKYKNKNKKTLKVNTLRENIAKS